MLVIYCNISCSSSYILLIKTCQMVYSARPKRYTIEWMQANRERERQDQSWSKSSLCRFWSNDLMLTFWSFSHNVHCFGSSCVVAISKFHNKCQENTNPVTRYLDRRRTERGGTWIVAWLSRQWRRRWEQGMRCTFWRCATVQPKLFCQDMKIYQI